jgi:hypothetical protein
MKRLIGILSVILAVPELAHAARDLGSATTAAVNQATTIAKAASVLGILAGAIAYQIPGAAMWGRGVIVSGFIGAGLAFGGPSIMGLFRTIFGG